MANQCINRAVIGLLWMTGWSLINVPIIFAQEVQTETRMQAMLQLVGTFRSGGFEIDQAPTQGPGANLKKVNGASTVRGILEKGDLIVEIQGRKFRDRRDFLDQMNDAYNSNNGEVKISVKDVNSGGVVIWSTKPVVARMEVPIVTETINFHELLGAPVEAASSVAILPTTIDP